MRASSTDRWEARDPQRGAKTQRVDDGMERSLVVYEAPPHPAAPMQIVSPMQIATPTDVSQSSITKAELTQLWLPSLTAERSL